MCLSKNLLLLFSSVNSSHSQLSKKQFTVVLDLESILFFPQRSVIQGCKLANCCQNGHGFCWWHASRAWYCLHFCAAFKCVGPIGLYSSWLWTCWSNVYCKNHCCAWEACCVVLRDHAVCEYPSACLQCSFPFWSLWTFCHQPETWDTWMAVKARGARKRRLMKYLGTILVKIEDFGKISLSEAIWDLVDTSRCRLQLGPFVVSCVWQHFKSNQHHHRTFWCQLCVIAWILSENAGNHVLFPSSNRDRFQVHSRQAPEQVTVMTD